MAHRVLILGGGFAGLTAARRLERLTPPASTQITVVNDVNFMLYTPLLPGAAGGTLEPRHVVVPLREQLRRTTELRLGRVTGANPAQRRVFVHTTEGRDEELAYDQLVVALGSTSRTLPIPGLREHALGFKTLSEAITLRNEVIQCMEKAEATEDVEERHALLTFVMVGAGYAGLEGIAELQDFAADVVDLYPRSRLHGLRFILVEAGPRVMKEVPEDLAEFASRELRRRGLEIRTNTTVERVSADSVELSTGEVVPTRTVCWTTGVVPHPVVAKLGLPLAERARDVAGDGLGLADGVLRGLRAGRVRGHGAPPGRRLDGRDQVARAPRLVPGPYLPPLPDARLPPAGPARGRLDGRPLLRARLLGARPARPPARARRRLRGAELGGHGGAGRHGVRDPALAPDGGGAATSSTERAPRHARSRRGGTARSTRTTLPAPSSHTRSSGKRMPNVCTQRQRGRCSARPRSRRANVVASRTRM
jgi:NADH dehydrogenase FAD-containing subunit